MKRLLKNKTFFFKEEINEVYKVLSSVGVHDTYLIKVKLENTHNAQDTWVAQSVKHLTSAQVMISQFVSSSPTSGSVLTAQSLEPASDSVSPLFCSFLTRALSYSLSLSQK